MTGWIGYCSQCLQVEIFHQQHSETRETVLPATACLRQAQANLAHAFVVRSLQENMAKTLKMNAATPTMREIEEKVAAEILRRTAAADDEGEPGDDPGDDDGDQGGGGDGSGGPSPKRPRGDQSPPASSSGQPSGRRLQLSGATRGRGCGSRGGRSAGSSRSRTPAGYLPNPRRRARDPAGEDDSSPQPMPIQDVDAAAEILDGASAPGTPLPRLSARSPGKGKMALEDKAQTLRKEVMAVAPGVLAGIR